MLDVACGRGRFLKLAREASLEVWGIDIADVALAQAESNVDASRLLLADGEHLPFRDNTFDYVTNLGSLEHFLSPEDGAREMARVVKRNGVVCVLLPNLYPLFEILHVLKTGYGRPRNQDLERFRAVNDWRDLLQENGLGVFQIHRNNGFGWDIKRIWLRPFVPFRLSENFAYLCRKAAPDG